MNDGAKLASNRNVMEHQLLPPSETAPMLPRGTSSVDAVRVWIDLMKSTDKFVLAGLAREAGSHSLHEAYRRWYAQQADRHGERISRLAFALCGAGEKDGDGSGS